MNGLALRIMNKVDYRIILPDKTMDKYRGVLMGNYLLLDIVL